MRAFLDTNICVYTYDGQAADKQATARRLLESDSDQLVVSTQVLQEFYSVVTRKLARPLPHVLAAQAVDALADYEVVASDAVLVRTAIEMVGQHQLSIWDALIIEAAVRGRCDVLYTEDLAAGSSIRGVEVVNPFA